MKATRKFSPYFLTAVFIIVLVFIGRPIVHFLSVGMHDNERLPETPPGFANDVSRLNQTKVDSIVTISGDKTKAYEQLHDLLNYARSKRLKISIAGAKHSMGGHTITPNGIVINMLAFRNITYDSSTRLLTAGGGALWSDIIPFLDKYGRSVSVMQSDNAFSVGGSISVNCHGWQHNKPPISSTVVSFRLMNAQGEILNCSRQENREIFSLAIGGYGLFGIILEADLLTVPNEAYTYHRILFSSEKYTGYYSQYINNNRVAKMAYGRLNVNMDEFLENAMLNYFVLDTIDKVIPPLEATDISELKRSVFLGGKDDNYGKKLRWRSEKIATKMGIGKRYSRNQVMNESPVSYMNKSPDKTDILHEYFIPTRNLEKFIRDLQRIIPKYNCDLMNITLRNVYPDEDTYLNYAREEVFGFVMFFNQPITKEAESDMERMTQELIDNVLKLDGTFYLPYRLHETIEQFRKAYPMAAGFFEKKRQYDPGEIFQNKFYQKYGKKNPSQPAL